jgi:hypothetical protein
MGKTTTSSYCNTLNLNCCSKAPSLPINALNE